jgi:hypothetical protein
MKILKERRGEQGSALLGYLFMALIVMAAVAAIGGLVVQNLKFAQRRQDMVNALQAAQGGAAICVLDVESAFTNAAGDFLSNLGARLPYPYQKNSSLTVGSQSVYQRVITNAFTNAPVTAQIWLTNSGSPGGAKVIASAAVGQAIQKAQMNLEFSFIAGAAIVSTAKGTVTTGTTKSTAQAGNVAVDASGPGITWIDGGILANGSANTNGGHTDRIAEGLVGTASELADYTSPGSSSQLFDFNRFIAVADATANHYATPAAFIAAASAPGAVLEGIVVVDIPLGSKVTLSPSTLPSGINVRGTLVFNFVGAWDPLDKIINTATININPANLATLNPNDPSSFPTGYPPTYLNPAKNPVNVNITAKGFENFTPQDDLPALMYNNAILDMHGDVNICGAVYSPSFMEIENKGAGQTQYIKGALIGGGGIFVENNLAATTIISLDPKAIQHLATLGARGKIVKVVYYK